MSDAESRAEDARREAWEDKHGIGGSDPLVRHCPECGAGALYLVERYEASRTEPGCELWGCTCGYEEEG